MGGRLSPASIVREIKAGRCDTSSSCSSGSEGEFYIESEGDPESNEEVVEHPPPQRQAMVVMACMIGGYTLIGPLQHDLKHALDLGSHGRGAEVFTQAVAMVQWGKTFMTLGQNLVLAKFDTMTRMYISMVLMFVGVAAPPIIVFTLGWKSVGAVAAAYGIIGLALGIFECTYLSVISPLGPLTKAWAIMGFPAAFGVVNVVGRSCMVLFHLPPEALFWCILCGIPVAVIVFSHIAPGRDQAGGRSYAQAGIRTSLRDWRTWFLRMVPFLLVNAVSHFVMESVLPAIFHTFNSPVVSLLGPADTSYLMNTNWFLVCFSIFNLAGDMISRRVGYSIDLTRYRSNFTALIFALSCSAAGLYLATLGIAIITWPAVFLAFWGAGFNYAVTSKYIDRSVPRRHNLAAYSVWCFVGYGGAIAGAVLVDPVKAVMCKGGPYMYQCH